MQKVEVHYHIDSIKGSLIEAQLVLHLLTSALRLHVISLEPKTHFSSVR